MRSKSWVIILVMGIIGFCALGFITKFALDSNPALMRIGKLKQALAEDYSSQKLGELSLKALPEHRGFFLRMETPRSLHPDPALFGHEVAENFVRRFDGPRPQFLKVAFVEPGRLGCPGSTVYYEKEISIDDLVNEMALRVSVEELERSFPPTAGLRVRPVRMEEPLKLAVEVPEPKSAADLENLVRELRSKAADHLAAGRGRTVLLEVWSQGPKGKLLREERLEPPSSRRWPPTDRAGK